MKEKWYELEKVNRIVDVIIPFPNPKWLRWLLIIPNMILHEVIYQDGVKLINDKGETKIIWEKIKKRR